MADSHKIYSHLQENFIEIFWLLWYNVTKRSRAQFDDLRTQSVLHCDVLKISISSTIPLCCMAGIKETVFSGLSFLQWQSKEQFPIK